ncbi:hypothetical protein [Streptomyces sp. NPDC026673]|uniref:hypothetical protein n=1 Tax=Streptomyces sp. NPDC026673 TaxID=3155724 RepID=UPI00340267C6
MNGTPPAGVILDEVFRVTSTVTNAYANFHAIAEQWPDLVDAIDRAPAAEWPPRESRGFLDQHPADGERARPHPDNRAPLVIREHPAPLNLDALDAAVSTERRLADLADRVAATVQRSIRSVPVPAVSRDTVWITHPADATDPARWHYAAPTSPGSRARGVPFAARWLAARVTGKSDGDLFGLLPDRLLTDAAGIARDCARGITRALIRDGRTTRLNRACPWCGARLTARTEPGRATEAVITCPTGQECGAPVLLDDRGRRAWAGADLVDLWAAIDAGQQPGK